MTLPTSCTVVFAGTGDLAALPPSVRQAIREADSLITWIEPPALLGDRAVVRLDTPSRPAWESRLLELRNGAMAYLAPGYGPDDDPGAVIVGDVMADIGVEVDVFGLGYPNLSGPAVVGPAIKSWRPDPALAAVVRGVRDAAELDRWRRTLTQEFGDAVRLRARIWTSTMWHDLREPPATFPLTLRAEPTDASHERSASRLRDVFETLRGPDGCPWDRAQTHASLRQYALEEAAEVVDAIDDGESAEIASELGDLLANIVLHTEIARQAEAFTWPDVVQGVTAKMVRRHPHVFGEQTAHQVSEAAAIWRHAKNAEARGGNEARTDGALPALSQAAKLAGTLEVDTAAARLPEGATAALRWFRDSETATDEARAGDAILGLALAAKAAGIDPELAVRDALRRLRAGRPYSSGTSTARSAESDTYVK